MESNQIRSFQTNLRAKLMEYKKIKGEIYAYVESLINDAVWTADVT
jgi:hypothetical protein